MLLERFRKAKMAEVAELKAKGVPKAYKGVRPDFLKALQGPGLSFIAEYKRASPSKGRIRDDLTVADVALAYAAHGAAAMSILTEAKYFDGDIGYLFDAHKTLLAKGYALPLLRKDFLFDPVQIEATAGTPASALLLIVKLVEDDALLQRLYERTRELGIVAVVEVTDDKDLARARDLHARCIQVNARDLETLTVNREKALALAHAHPPRAHETWIFASGIEEAKDCAQLTQAGFAACLVGTALMQGNPGDNLARLVGGCRDY